MFEWKLKLLAFGALPRKQELEEFTALFGELRPLSAGFNHVVSSTSAVTFLHSPCKKKLYTDERNVSGFFAPMLGILLYRMTSIHFAMVFDGFLRLIGTGLFYWYSRISLKDAADLQIKIKAKVKAEV